MLSMSFKPRSKQVVNLKYEPKQISVELTLQLLKMEEIVIDKLERMGGKRRKAVRGYLPGLKMLGEMIEEGKRQERERQKGKPSYAIQEMKWNIRKHFM